MVKKNKETLAILFSFVATLILVLLSYVSFKKGEADMIRQAYNDSILNIIKKDDSVIKVLKTKADKKCPEIPKKKKVSKSKKIDTIYLDNGN